MQRLRPLSPLAAVAAGLPQIRVVARGTGSQGVLACTPASTAAAGQTFSNGAALTRCFSSLPSTKLSKAEPFSKSLVVYDSPTPHLVMSIARIFLLQGIGSFGFAAAMLVRYATKFDSTDALLEALQLIEPSQLANGHTAFFAGVTAFGALSMVAARGIPKRTVVRLEVCLADPAAHAASTAASAAASSGKGSSTKAGAGNGTGKEESVEAHELQNGDDIITVYRPSLLPRTLGGREHGAVVRYRRSELQGAPARTPMTCFRVKGSGRPATIGLAPLVDMQRLQEKDDSRPVYTLREINQYLFPIEPFEEWEKSEAKEKLMSAMTKGKQQQQQAGGASQAGSTAAPLPVLATKRAPRSSGVLGLDRRGWTTEDAAYLRTLVYGDFFRPEERSPPPDANLTLSE